jgi:ankyrin repeat protein
MRRAAAAWAVLAVASLAVLARAGQEAARPATTVDGRRFAAVATSYGNAIGDAPPLVAAAARGDEKTVAELLAAGADPNQTAPRWPGDSGWTPLMIAAAAGHDAVCQALLRAGAEVDQPNGARRTALSFAAFYGRNGAIAVLLAAGADPFAADARGQTPIELATLAGDHETVNQLQESVARRERDRLKP